jgi:hypothetical protein
MKQIVFYSWQSDLPNACNRGFIQKALENAAATIKADDSVEIEPVVDRDTLGMPGAPDIASTIFSKITAADVFVADVSITGRGEKRATPNPNVLIELGYALKALGHERVIPVFNCAFGKIEELPFDLRNRRVLAYAMTADKERGPERKLLEKQLDAAIRSALATGDEPKDAPANPAIQAIENHQPNRIIVLRRNLEKIIKELERLEPKKPRDGGTVDELIAALPLTQEPVAEFSKLAEVAVVMNDNEAVLEIYRSFGRIFERYDLPQNFSGAYSKADQDYFKFLGHELVVTVVAFLLREQRWQLLETVLAEPIPVRYMRRDDRPGSVDWTFGSEHLLSLMGEGSRRHRVSLQADILKDRHTIGGLATILPMEEFVAADYFLFLMGELSAGDGPHFSFDWRPWSAIYLHGTPLFLRNAERKQIAKELMKLFKVDTAEKFRQRFAERAYRLRELFQNTFWDEPVRDEDIQKFGTR